ncbi:TonB-dependent receptor [Corticimicrobacter populi]|uniref:TonB-dependent receptor n=2 Tax=Corticimicrobacter populi TaxID=2175229 RepID=A0A2V1K7P1_9BURK|nr:TonB-dependent receptor [Corticimicrobacter populi]
MLQRTNTIQRNNVARMDTLTVTGTYETAGAHSTRTLNQNLQSLDATLRSMAGTYTQLDPLQAAVSVNIRGMSGLGRVNTMIDGVTQTFFGVAPAGYHGNGANSGAGALIDPNFLVGVDVTRGNSAGSQGINALAGSANMRTLGVDDILFEERNTGVMGRFSVGSNGLGRSGMVAMAGRTPFSDTGSIGGLVGISGSTVHATYNNGSGRSSSEFLGEDPQFMKQHPRSQLYKLEIRPDSDNRLELSGRSYTNSFNRRDLNSEDYYLKYNYSPRSDLVNLNVQVSNSRSRQDYEYQALSAYAQAAVRNRSNSFDINNTSRFAWSDYELDLLVGGKFMDTTYSRNIVREYEDEGRNGFMPAGRQKISSLYSTLTLRRDIYQLDLGLNYTRSNVIGNKPACPDTIRCFPQGAARLDLTDTAINPSATFGVQVAPWFRPFVSYSHSSRAPNVQEVFFSNEGGGSMNPFLKPEEAETWQAGFDIFKQGLLTEKDTFQLKALAYRTRIRNYITSESFFLCYDGARCKDIDNSYADFNAHIAINSLTPVTTRGYELEARYDAGIVYASLSWSKQKTDQPTSIVSTTQLGFGYDDMSDLPNSYATLDIGARLLDRQLVVGGLAKFTGKSRRLSTEGISLDTNRVEKEDMPSIPTIFDIYASYQLSRNVMLRASVQNVGNKDYAEALNRMNQDLYYAQEGASVNTTARGRTYMVSTEIRF